MENFDENGRILFKNIDKNGRLIFSNQNSMIVPNNKIIFEEENIKLLPEYLIDTSIMDPKKVRIRLDCKKCKDYISIILRVLNQTFYICINCKNVVTPDQII